MIVVIGLHPLEGTHSCGSSVTGPSTASTTTADPDTQTTGSTPSRRTAMFGTRRRTHYCQLAPGVCPACQSHPPSTTVRRCIRMRLSWTTGRRSSSVGESAPRCATPVLCVVLPLLLRNPCRCCRCCICTAKYIMLTSDGSFLHATGQLLFDEETGSPTFLYNGAIDKNRSVPWYAMAQGIRS
eukprot:SAG22_NODE_2852_length_2156_cov_13.308216_2_plen_183_part_00